MTLSWDAIQWGWTSLFLTWTVGGLVLFTWGMLSEGGWQKEKNRKTMLRSYAVAGAFIAMLFVMQITGPWKILDQGVYDRVQYVDTPGMTSTGASYKIHETIISFKDGRTRVVSGSQDIPYPKGTLIRILEKNDLYKIERIE